MNREQFDAWERRIKTQANQLWQQAGSPEGQRDRFSEQARELLAIKENPDAGTLDPEEAARPVIEEAALMRNLGEFPTLTDQGDEMTYPDDLAPDFPDADPSEADTSDDRDIHLSDDDAADDGGVLPLEETPASRMPDISVADADITTDTTDADATAPQSDDNPVDDDLNDDGLPDQPGFFRAAGRRSK